MNFEQFKDLVITAANEQGVTAYELYYSHVADTSYAAYQGEIDNLSSSDGDGACFRCLVDGKMGYASTELLSAEEAVRLVTDAKACAAILEGDDPAFLYDGKDAYATMTPCATTMEPAAAQIDKTLALEKACFAADDRIKAVADCTVGEVIQEKRIVNSYGLDLASRSHRYLAYAQVTAEENGDVQAGLGASFGKTAEQVDTAYIVKTAVEEAIGSLGAEGVPSGKYKIVFSSDQMATLLETFSGVFSADAAQKGLSLLADKENTVIASELVTLCDDPLCEQASVAATFDGEGVATYKKNIIQNGVFTTLLHNLKTAHKAGVKSTGNASKGSFRSKVSIAPFAFYIENGNTSLEQLFFTIGNGLYITELQGMHAGASTVTGDFSLAAKGFRIENGQKTKPVKGFTVAGNFFSLLKSVDGIADNLKFTWPGATTQFGAPAVSVGELSVAGE